MQLVNGLNVRFWHIADMSGFKIVAMQHAPRTPFRRSQISAVMHLTFGAIVSPGATQCDGVTFIKATPAFAAVWWLAANAKESS